jgi:hypothetical protein
MTFAPGTLGSGEASILCMSRLDRLARSMADLAGLMAQVQVEGWAIVALDLSVDTTTAEAEMMAQGVRLGREPVIGHDVAAVASRLRGDGLTLRAIGAER